MHIQSLCARALLTTDSVRLRVVTFLFVQFVFINIRPISLISIFFSKNIYNLTIIMDPSYRYCTLIYVQRECKSSFVIFKRIRSFFFQCWIVKIKKKPTMRKRLAPKFNKRWPTIEQFRTFFLKKYLGTTYYQSPSSRKPRITNVSFAYLTFIYVERLHGKKARSPI